MKLIWNLFRSWRGGGATALPRIVNGIAVPVELDFVGGQLFEETGNEFLKYFTTLGGLKPDHDVLDVGCGIGRMAIPLAGFLNSQGSYKGFDIVPHGIQWCQENISPKYPKFEFFLADVYNKQYNPTGTSESASYKFPFANESFDFIFLTSVFTHMLSEDLENYLSEICRVLRPGGSCLITFFLINADSEALIQKGKSYQNFQHKIGVCHIVNQDMPESSTGYDEAHIRALYGKYGLAINEPIHFGGWSGRWKFTSYQDIVCGTKL